MEFLTNFGYEEKRQNASQASQGVNEETRERTQVYQYAINQTEKEMRDCKRQIRYAFTLQKDYEYKSNIVGQLLIRKYLKIHTDGTIKIPAGYSWDGCTPKFCFLGTIVGTPDGPIMEDGLPQTYYASLVHDALYQYHRGHTIPRKVSDLLFLKMMREAGFRFANLYYRATRLLYPLYKLLTRELK